MDRDRADYASSSLARGSSLLEVTRVEPGSAAAKAGLSESMRIVSVNGEKISDVIDWLWETDTVNLEIETENPRRTISFSRPFGSELGVEFADPIPDGIMTCKNSCAFCFMSMLPSGTSQMRQTLYVRDDDYRLSFLQGNFVTLTNLTEKDVDRIIERHLSPLHVSVHSTDPEVRARIIGRNEHRGIEVLADLLEAGIEVHAQIVLMPGENDGDDLARTLEDLMCEENIRSVGVVPLGYTRFQERFVTSYSDDPKAAAEVVSMVEAIARQERARTGEARVYLADEFYIDAHLPLPAFEDYDDFPQYEDGIGMTRAFLEESQAIDDSQKALLEDVARKLKRADRKLVLVTGTLFEPYLCKVVRALFTEGRSAPEVLGIENDFFGGNVSVTGLLTGIDLVKALSSLPGNVIAILPDIVFNASGVTLDDMDIERLRSSLSCQVSVVSCTFDGLLTGILHAVDKIPD